MRPQISDKEFSNYAYVNPDSGSRYGVQIADFGNASTNSAGTFAAVDPSTVVTNSEESPTSLLQLTQDAALSMYQVSPNSGNGSPNLGQTIKTLGFWYLAPDLAGPRPAEIRVYANPTSRLLRANIILEPTSTWKFAIVQRQQFGENTILSSDPLLHVRFTQQNSATSFPANWDSWQSGEIVYFGPVYANPRTRSKFMLAIDDVTENVLVDGAGGGYPTSGKNYKDIFDFYGFSGTVYVASSFIGGAGYATWAHLKTLKNAGWTIGSISRDHPNDGSNRGLMLDGPYNGGTVTAIIDDIQGGIDDMVAQGIGEDAYYFGLPGGGWDSYVRDAALTIPLKTIRGTALFNGGQHSIPVGVMTGGGNLGSTLRMSGWINQPGSLSIATASNAELEAYVDEIIAIGATGMGHVHGITGAIATSIDYLCDYLKTKQNQGLIDVVNVKGWYGVGS